MQTLHGAGCTHGAAAPGADSCGHFAGSGSAYFNTARQWFCSEMDSDGDRYSRSAAEHCGSRANTFS